jgi:hypothetical protein
VWHWAVKDTGPIPRESAPERPAHQPGASYGHWPWAVSPTRIGDVMKLARDPLLRKPARAAGARACQHRHHQGRIRAPWPWPLSTERRRDDKFGRSIEGDLGSTGHQHVRVVPGPLTGQEWSLLSHPLSMILDRP